MKVGDNALESPAVRRCGHYVPHCDDVLKGVGARGKVVRIIKQNEKKSYLTLF